MARLNQPVRNTEVTHEGAPAYGHLTAEQALRRSVLSCLLWENEFYEDGEEIASRIIENAAKVPPQVLADLAVEARSRYNLRHVPLLLLSVLAKTGSGSSIVSDAVAKTVQRADELSELLAIYAKVNGVTPDKVRPKIALQLRHGLARAFTKFDEYQLSKYDRAGAIRLRDVLFMTHPKPLGLARNGEVVLTAEEQDALWKRLIANELKVPDTWEVALSGGADKKEAFERLITEGKLGYLALLRNLRNMTESNVDLGIIRQAILARKGAHRVLPFRYVAAARACPQLEPELDRALCASIDESPRLDGLTLVLVDVSGSMDHKLSARSDLRRMDAGAVLASIIKGDRRVFSFSDGLAEVPPRTGMAGVDVICNSQPHHGTHLGEAVVALNQLTADRLIVITDEQSHTRVPDPKHARSYMINVASNKNGVGYGRWIHIDGFSEQVLRFIKEVESDSTE